MLKYLNKAIKQKTPIEEIKTRICNFSHAELHQKDKNGLTPLQHMVIQKQNKIVAFLHDYLDSDLDDEERNKNSSLYLAIMTGNLSAFEMLMQRKIEVYLNWAYSFNRRDIARYLECPNGANPSNPYHVDLSISSIPLMKTLIKNGVNFNNVKNSGDETYLHYAVMDQSLKNVKFLISLGLDVNAKDDIGKHTALMLSVLHSKSKNTTSIKIIRHLIENGAFIETTNEDDETVFELAERHIPKYKHYHKLFKSYQKHHQLQLYLKLSQLLTPQLEILSLTILFKKLLPPETPPLLLTFHDQYKLLTYIKTTTPTTQHPIIIPNILKHAKFIYTYLETPEE